MNFSKKLIFFFYSLFFGFTYFYYDGFEILKLFLLVFLCIYAFASLPLKKIKFNIIDIILLIYFLIPFFFIKTFSNEYAFKSLVFIFVYFLLRKLQFNKANLKRIIFHLQIISVFICFLLIFKRFSIIFPADTPDNLTMGNKNFISAFLLMLLFLQSYFIFNKNKIMKKITFFVIPVNLLSLYLIYTRSAFLIIIFMLSITLLFLIKKRFLKIICVSLYISGIFFTGFFLVKYNLIFSTLKNRFLMWETVLAIKNDNLFNYGSLVKKEYPLFQGKVILSKLYKNFHLGRTDNAHNSVLQALTDKGILAASLYILLFFVVLRKINDLINKRKFNLLFFSLLSLTSYFLYSLLSFAPDTVFNNFLFLFLLSVNYSSIEKIKNKNIEKINFLNLCLYLILIVLCIKYLIFQAYLKKVENLNKMKNYAETEKMSEIAVKLCPSDRVYFYKGINYQNFKQYEKSIKSLLIDLQQNPYYPEIIYNIAQGYKYLKQYNAAKYYYKLTSDINPLFELPYFVRGNIEMDLKNYKEAERLFKKSVYLKKDFIDGYYNLGILFSQIRFVPKKAIMYYNAVIKLDNHHSGALSNLAITYAKLKEYKQAINILNYLIKQEPYNYNAYMNLLMMYREIKDKPNTEKITNIILKKFPNAVKK